MDGYINDFDEALDALERSIEEDMIAIQESMDEAFDIIFDEVFEDDPNYVIPDDLYDDDEPDEAPWDSVDGLKEGGDYRGPFETYTQAAKYTDSLKFAFWSIVHDSMTDAWYVEINASP